MFAVIEFDNKKRECSVIPLIWLTDDRKQCYWPKGIDDKQLQNYVNTLTPAEADWTLHPIRKIHYTAGIICKKSATKYRIPDIFKQQNCVSEMLADATAHLENVLDKPVTSDSFSNVAECSNIQVDDDSNSRTDGQNKTSSDWSNDDSAIGKEFLKSKEDARVGKLKRKMDSQYSNRFQNTKPLNKRLYI